MWQRPVSDDCRSREYNGHRMGRKVDMASKETSNDATTAFVRAQKEGRNRERGGGEEEREAMRVG